MECDDAKYKSHTGACMVKSAQDITDFEKLTSPEMERYSPAGNEYKSGPQSHLRSASYCTQSNGRNTNSCSRSKTWEGFSEIHDFTNKEEICKNNSTEFSRRDGDNRPKAVVAESRALDNPTSYSDNEEMLTEEVTKLYRQASICGKCSKKKQEQKSIASNKKKMFNNVRTFAICLSMLQLVQVMGSGYSKSALTSVERRYRLSTFSVGLLQSCFHIGNLSVILFVSYFGSKWNRPRAIAIGSMIMAVSSLLSAMPQFVGSRYRVAERDSVHESDTFTSPSMYMKDVLNIIMNDTLQPQPLTSGTLEIGKLEYLSGQNSGSLLSLKERKERKAKLCILIKPILNHIEVENSNKTSTTEGRVLIPVVDAGYAAQKAANFESEQSTIYRVKDSESENESEYWNDSSFYIFIAVGSVMKGMGHSPLHPLGMSFIDDYATPRNSAVYIGVVSALSLLGPACGFILGSLTTGTWVDWGWVDVSKIQIGPHHPLWVGAWWIGYLVTAFLLLMATIPLCLFPRKIPKEEEEEDDTNDGTCLLCFRRCYTDQSKQITENQSDQETSDIKAEDDTATSKTINLCDCETDVKDANRNFHLSKIPNCNDKSDAYKIKMTGKTFLGTKVEIEDNFDEVHAAQLISYLEKPKFGKDSIHTDVSNGKHTVPFSYSEMKLSTSKKNSMTSHITNNMKKSTSLPNADYQFLNHKLSNISKRKSDAIAKISNSRRPSKLEKLALFDFTESLKGLLTDVVFISITLAFVCLTSFLAASVTYVSKYMETQFSVTASFANLLNGSVNLPMAVVGNLLGGWLIRRFNLNVKHTMVVVVTGLAMTIVCVTVLLLFKCSQGSHVEYSIGSDGGNCASQCSCADVYAPVCDVTTNTTYRSACHAGCNDVSTWRKTKVYTGCRCVGQGLKNNRTAKQDSSVHNWGPSGAILFRGPCHRPDCSKSHLPVFLGVMGTASLTAGLASTPSTLVILRIVPPAEKAFAIGIVFVFTRILAWIPAPVYVGYVIDSACLRWSYLGGIPYREDATKQERNHCEIYDKDRLRRNFFAATGGLLVLSLIFYILALYLQTKRSKRQKRQSKESNLLSFHSLLVSGNASPMTSPLRQKEQHEATDMTEINEEKLIDKQIEIFEQQDSAYLIQLDDIANDSEHVLRKVVVSASAPVLCCHNHESHLLMSQEHNQINVIRATVV